jgi:hypothetical protein
VIFLGLALRNPWSTRFQHVAERVIAVSKNKTIELGLYKDNCIFECSFGITGFKQDHAGVRFNIGLLGYTFDFTFYHKGHYSERTN